MLPPDLIAALDRFARNENCRSYADSDATARDERAANLREIERAIEAYVAQRASPAVSSGGAAPGP